MNEDLSKYKESYITEASDHLEAMNRCLLCLEKSPGDPAALGEIFRAVHTLKSMAATMGYTETAHLCHGMEDLLTRIRDQKVDLGKWVDLLFSSLDLLQANLTAISEGHAELDTQALVQNLLQANLEQGLPGAGEPGKTKALMDDTGSRFIEKIQRIHVKVERLDTLMHLAEELLVSNMQLGEVSEKIGDPELTAVTEKMERLIAELQYNVMQVRMVAIGFIFNRFPRLVRDLAKIQGKEVELVLEGGDIEVDRGLIDEMSEALVHLLRNAVDHGLERPEERKKKGKGSTGVIHLSAMRTKDEVIIQVKDDGLGLDWDEIRRIALSKGLLKTEEGMEALEKILFAGLSTSREVTDISGRGIGLPVVKKKMDAIRGLVRVTSNPGGGTLFTLKIPLTLAIIKTLFAQVNGKTYAIPVVNVERLVTVHESAIKWQMGTEALVLGGEDVPLIRLTELFCKMGKGHSSPKKSSQLSVVVVKHSGALIGLGVDSLLATDDVVVKPLSPLVQKNLYFSGSAVIGSGEVVLIVDVKPLAMSQRNHSGASPHPLKRRSYENRFNQNPSHQPDSHA